MSSELERAKSAAYSPLLPRVESGTIPPVYDLQNKSQNDSNTSLRSDVGFFVRLDRWNI